MVLEVSVNRTPVAEVASRLLKANRFQFDTLAPLGAAQQRIQSLELEAAHLRAVISSTSWKVTAPLRWAVDRLRSFRQASQQTAGPAPSGAGNAAIDYGQWIALAEPGHLERLRSTRPGFEPAGRPRLGVVLFGQGDDGAMLDAVLAGRPPDCRVLVLQDDTEALRTSRPALAGQLPVVFHSLPRDGAEPAAVRLGLQLLDTDLICFLDSGCELRPFALELAATRLARQPELDILFADEDWKDPDGARVRPFFKPGWNAELQRGCDLAGPFVLFRSDLARAAKPVAGPAWLYDLTNQVAAVTNRQRIGHIPAVLAHRLRLREGHAEALERAAAYELRKAGVTARIEPMMERTGWQRVTYKLPAPEPLVSVIVPTRDHPELLRVCAESVLERTDYRHLELLIVDNGTVEPEALALLDSLAWDERVTVLRDDRPFNWSALNNAAARRAAGDVLLLLNNDIAMLRPDWLTELVSHALQPGVGAAGAKMLYPDGRVQHAGLTTNVIGIPRHLLRHAPGDGPGPYDLMGLAREVWGVTGACVAIPRTVFFDVGGLNEALPVAYNDVDLCLRLTAHGYRIVWTPWSVLEHRELASRPDDHTAARRAFAAEELRRLGRDWGALLQHDPYLNPNLELDDEWPCLQAPRPAGP